MRICKSGAPRTTIGFARFSRNEYIIFVCGFISHCEKLRRMGFGFFYLKKDATCEEIISDARAWRARGIIMFREVFLVRWRVEREFIVYISLRESGM